MATRSSSRAPLSTPHPAPKHLLIRSHRHLRRPVRRYTAPAVAALKGIIVIIVPRGSVERDSDDSVDHVVVASGRDPLLGGPPFISPRGASSITNTAGAYLERSKSCPRTLASVWLALIRIDIPRAVVAVDRRSRPCEHRARGHEREDGGRSTRRGPREKDCASLAVLGRVQSPSSIQIRMTRRRGRCSTRQCGTCAKPASFHLLSLLLLLLLFPTVYGHAMCGQGYQHA